MSDSNRESLGFIAESTFGVNPGGTKQLINFTSNSLNQGNVTQESKFVRDDTNRAGTIRTGIQSGGNIGIELQYGGYDSFIEAALRGTFGTAVDVTATTLSAADSDNSLNCSASTSFANVVAGQWLKISGFTTAANNGYAFVVSRTTSKLVLAGINLADEAAGDSVRIKGTVCKNGTTKKSFTFERSFSDISQFMLLTGQRVNELGFNFNTQSIASGSITLLGQDAAVSGTSGFSGSTAAATTASMNTVDNIKAIYIDKALSTDSFMSLDFKISTNSAELNAIGALSAFDVRQGSISVSGTLTAYFEDLGLLGKQIDYTNFDLAFVTEDSAGNGYIWHFPNCNFLTGSPDNKGIDTTLDVPLTFAATLNPTAGITASVTRFPV